MKPIGNILLVAFMFLPALPLPGEETDIGRLEGLVAQWVRLRAETAAEKRVWREQEARLSEEIALHEKEKADLEAIIADARQTSSEADAERAKLRTRKGELQAAHDALLPILDRAEAAARGWAALVPVSLRGELKEAFARLPRTHQEATRLTLSRRLQIVVAFYTSLESLQNSVHLVKEMLSTADGERREMDVLYLGLGRGFAVSPDGSWAAAGTPGTDGWTWQADAALAPDVRRAIGVYQRRIPAAFVPLPLAVANGERGGQ